MILLLSALLSAGTIFAEVAGFWKLDGGSGQSLGNAVCPQEKGWLGNAESADSADPEFVVDEGRKVLYFELGKYAVIPNGSYADFAKAKGFSIQLWFKPMVDFSGRIGRIQLLTKGADSNSDNWQLRMRYNYKIKKNMISFFFRKGRDKAYSISAPIGNLADKWTRVTVTGDGKELKLFINGKTAAVLPCNAIPGANPYPLKLGIYAFGGKFGFAGTMKDLKIYKEVITPAPVKESSSGKVLLVSDFSLPSSVKQWTPANGQWLWSKNAYCEMSDLDTVPGVWSFSGDSKWQDYCFSAAVECADNLGDVLLSTGWRDLNNHYEIQHRRCSTGMVELSIIKVDNGRRTDLARLDSSESQLPDPAIKQQMKYKIYHVNGIIAVMINGRFYISAKVKRDTPGKVALGARKRKIMVRNAAVTSVENFVNPVPPAEVKPLELKIFQKDRRHVFFRGENIILNIRLRNNTPNVTKPETVKVTVDNRIMSTWDIPTGQIAPGANVTKTFTIPTIAWKSGKYEITAKLPGTPYSFAYDLFIMPETRNDTYKFFSWGGRTDASFFKSLESHGFNGSSVNVPPDADYRKQKAYFAKVLDEAMKHGQRIKLHFNCLAGSAPGSDTRIARFNGQKGHAADPWNPNHRQWVLTRFKKLMTLLNRHPAITDFLLNSENENIAEPDYSSTGRARVKKELGFDMPVPANTSQIKDGVAGRMINVPDYVKSKTPPVFADNNKWYVFFKWFWQRGYGDNYLNAELAEIIKRNFPGSSVTHDPYRDVPLFYRNKGLDQVGTWFYSHPDASETLGVAEVLVNASQDEKKAKGLNFGASLWLYKDKICPSRHRYAGVQPSDIIIESDWLAFSRIPDVIEHYSLNHLMPTARPEYKQKDIYEKLARFSREVLQPFWPMVSRLDRSPRECAMLLSFGSQLFGNKIWSGYGTSTGFGYYAALQMAHIPTDIIFDENILRGDLSKYKVLFMHRITHLPESVFRRIADFAKKGGIVICGEPFANRIPGAIKFDMDMSKRSKSTYYHIVSKKGFTADAVYRDMLKNADAVRAVTQNIVKRFVDCSSPQVFLNTLQKDRAKYVFVVNDKRTFGNYVGKKYRAVMEQGLPQTVKLSFDKSNGVVYDLLSHRRLDSVKRNGKMEVTIDLQPAWGTILAIYPEALADIDCVVPPKFKAGSKEAFKIRLLDQTGNPLSGIQPLKIDIADPAGNQSEFSGYFAAVNGLLKIKFIPAENDLKGKWTFRVTDLSSGKFVRKTFAFDFQ